MLRTIFIGVLAAASLGATSTYNVTINTSVLGSDGDTGFLVWDFTSGGSAPFNVDGIEGFSSDGTLGDATTQSTIGNVCPDTYPSPCSPPPGYVFISPVTAVVMEVDPIDSPFSEYQIGFTFGTTISFTLNATQNGPGAGQTPDELSFYFLGPDDATPLITTGDPLGPSSGIYSLLTLDIDGSTNGIPSVYPANDGSMVTATMTPSGGTSVPEPSTWPVLLAVGLLVRFTSLRGSLKARRFCNLTTASTRDSLD